MRRAVKTEAQRLLNFGIEPSLVRSAVARVSAKQWSDFGGIQRDRPVIHGKRTRISR
jgi:hypothetical protein